MILNIDKYNFDLPNFDDDEKTISKLGGNLRAVPMNSKSMDFAVRFQNSIGSKVMKMFGITEPIDKEFKSNKYRHGIAFIKTDGLLSDGRKATGLWPSRIDKDEHDRYIISFSVDTIM